MSQAIFQVSSFTPLQQADGQLAVGSFAAIKGTAATDILKISKVLLSGQSIATAVTATCLARSSTLGATPTTLALPNSNGYVNPNANPAGIPVCFVAATTAPFRASPVGVARMNLTFNAFGGIVQFQATPGMNDDWISVGNTVVNSSETILSSANVGVAGIIGADFFYELM